MPSDFLTLPHQAAQPADLEGSAHDAALSSDLAELRRSLQPRTLEQQLAETRHALKERTRELAESRNAQALLLATIDATSDGILATQFSDGAMYYNIRFVEMWGIPEDRLEMLDEATLTGLQLAQAKDPQALLRLIERRQANHETEETCLVELADGRVLERKVQPQRLRGQVVGSVVSYRDVTQRVRHEPRLTAGSHDRAAGEELRQARAFTVRLGVSDVALSTLLPDAGLRGLRALVVDDSEHARAVMSDLLRGMTFDVTAAASGMSALALLQSAEDDGRAYDVVYLDWRMPVMDGVETVRRIRALRLANPPAIVMATAHGREDVADLLRGSGEAAVPVLAKPVSPSTLFDTTMDLLGRQREPRPAAAGPAGSAGTPAQLAARRGARILLVEDNDINQEVASAMLGDAGFQVDIAGNGQVALDRVRSTPYDIVLMDMQMPVMDGVNATQAIRRIPALRRLPIVAMTANAMAHDRRRCVEAGMNDFILKPIDPAQLWATLAKWIRPVAGDAAAAAPTLQTPGGHVVPMPPQAAGTALDGIAGLDAAQGLARVMGKQPVYMALLERFAMAQRSVPGRIRRALDRDDWATALRLVHTCKGVAANIGAQHVPGSAAALEEAIRLRAARAVITPLLLEFELLLGELVAALEAVLPAAPDAPADAPMALAA